MDKSFEQLRQEYKAATDELKRLSKPDARWEGLVSTVKNLSNEITKMELAVSRFTSTVGNYTN